MSASAYVFEPNQARAGALPASWYTDPAYLALARIRNLVWLLA